MSIGITYALIVGIENYNQPKHFKKVKYIRKDAEEFSKALIGIGVHADDITMLLDNAATKTAIKKEVKNIAKKVLENDRIIFFFSGHGAYESKQNYLLPADCYNDDIEGTSVSINFILGTFNNSKSERNLLFLDCCHSGFEPGDNTKEINKTFLADELIYNAREEEYTLGFASCKSNQTSINHPQLQHSVWTHFLIKAFLGDADGIYEEGLLFSDRLQSYLNKNTKEFVKLNTLDKKDQVPMVFGNTTDRFIVADINPIFQERNRLKQTEALSFKNISIFSNEQDKIKNLPGFQKGFHKVPTSSGTSQNGFVQDISTSIIKNEISDLSQEIRENLKYRRTEIRVSEEKGVGTIETSDFDYIVTVEQSDTDPEEYIITRTLENFKNSEIVFNPAFNDIFSTYFDRLAFTLSKEINVTLLIDKIEELDSKTVKVNYNPANTKSCNIIIEGLQHTIKVTSQSVTISSPFQTSPRELIDSLKETQRAILSIPDLKLLD
jgi:hypothetical protein